MNSAIAGTTGLDPAAAARELVSTATRNLSGHPSLAILFATTDCDLAPLLAGVQAQLGEVMIWGATSSTGVFAGGQWLTGSANAALMLVSNRRAGAALEPVGNDPRGAGQRAATAALDVCGPGAAVCLLTTYPGVEEEILCGLHSVAPGIKVVGGSASDHRARPCFAQFGSSGMMTGGIAVAALAGNLGTAFGHGYTPAGKRAIVTRAAGRRLITIDNQPALQVYSAWTGLPMAEVSGSRLASLSVQRALLWHSDHATLAVHPVSGNSDGGIETGVAVPTGATVELGIASNQSLLAEVRTVVSAAAQQVKQPEALILAHCGGRALGLAEKTGEVTRHVEAVLPGVPWIGFLAFGEQGSVAGVPRHANLSLSALVLGR